MPNPLIKTLIQNISDLSTKLNTLIIKENKIESIWLEHLNLGKSILEWTIRKYKLSFSGEPKVVKKNYIFYCELGYNIGSEQNGKRPVVILQNDKGNSSSNTTIAAPITTHRGMTIVGKTTKGKTIVEYINDDGTKSRKVLDYYEIPVEIEPGYKKEIIGYINLAHVRTISKKRLDKSHVAIITKETNNKIAEGFKKLLSF
ncbi:MAG TPA: type II toxin-antitoxin system PemK/MazF family toxin [Tissierellia bacterium]|nr:type II toxin-antitoxin system PemK/MazF family toxin [Tissierellia bacterium]